MLALTRRVGEEVIIGDPRKPLGVIRVVEIHGDKVRLSFDFPRDMQINRKELAEQKARQELPNNGTPGSAASSPQPPATPPKPATSTPPAADAPPASSGPGTPPEK